MYYDPGDAWTLIVVVHETPPGRSEEIGGEA